MAKELGYAFDVKPDDVFFWVTDIGWMMGPWELIGVHFFGATVVLFEGAPNWPHPGRLWEACAELRATHLGISPTVIRLLMRESLSIADAFDLSSLKYLGSTGEPWDPDSYQWFFDHVGGSRAPHHQHLRRHRDRRLLPHAAADHVTQADDAARTGAGHGHRLRRRRGPAGARADSATSSAGARRRP